jgi:GTP diphosphokinase / guanosine-3',5'-bis(diphosphate) 3'-diphosphatase
MSKNDNQLKATFLSKVNKLLPDITKEQSDLINRAYEFAKQAHQGQKRASGTPYFDDHCVHVAEHILDLGMDTPLVCAALLHDTVEDTKVTQKELQKQFGSEIAMLVQGVSKLGKIKYHGNERHVESLRKFFVSVAKDARVVILKLADRWHNLETLQYLPSEKQHRIALESIMIHAPLASRMGMGKLVSTINDLAFPYAFPEEYKKTKKIMDSMISNADATIVKMHRNLSADLHNTLHYLPQIDERIKGTYSLYKKLVRKKWNTESIYDLVAIRAIVHSVSDCYQALGAIHSHWRPIPGRVKDYIAVPKPNGYQSLHTAVFSGDGPIVEIQIRTQEMHEFNEYGIASHHSYKNNRVQKGSDKESFAWIEQLRELQKTDMSTNDYLTQLKTDFFQDRIFVFTPKGDVIDLPVGATILDFAYAVHGKIGEHAGGGRINGKFMALKTPLVSEQIVEIVTNPKAKPSDKWLEMCITSNALASIRRKLKKQRQII